MAKDKSARRSAGGAMTVWANLVGAMVLTMVEEKVERAAIHRFLDHLERANVSVLRQPELEFTAGVIAIFRTMVPSND